VYQEIMTKDTTMNTIPRTLLAVAVALSLAIPGLASADRRGEGHRNHGDRHGYKHDYKHGHRKHHRDRHHDRHYRFRDRHHGGHYYRPGRYSTYYYGYDDDDDDLLTGLVVGGILGYALNGARHSGGYDYYDRAAVAPAYPAENYSYSSGDTCLQEREYQTTVVVGGKNVPAYGTACLQPDGSWKRETPRLVNY
jgi:hypothetical protein